MRKLFLFLFIFSTAQSFAQFRLAFLEGGQHSSVLEENNLAGWNARKGYYSARTGAHFGILGDLPVRKGSSASIQLGVIYYNKGRKFDQAFDTSTSPIIRINSTQYTNYIDVPLNLVYRIGNKVKFIFGGGPYASFFYKGKETSQTLYLGNVLQATENNNVPVGDKPGQYKALNYGANALAGFEVGRVFFTANYGRGLNDFYHAVNYKGKFKHQVIGITLGVFLGKPATYGKQEVKDRDHDGIPDDKDNCPKEPGTAATNGCPDKDGDGVIDKDDQCPDQPGLAINKGCPVLDRDKDGVIDKDDKCPDVAGSQKYSGCPVPDRDKDGVNDEEDKCPDVPGSKKYNGCPIPDTDGDGVNDEEDRCPTVKGTKANNGCPAGGKVVKKEIAEKVSYVAKRIQFTSAKADLLPQSYKVLDDIVKILKENPELNLFIGGHTSNGGVLAANMKLSQERTDRVKAYLVQKGIAASRITTRGFGPTQPLNHGTTEAEKALNRRVELKLSN